MLEQPGYRFDVDFGFAVAARTRIGREPRGRIGRCATECGFVGRRRRFTFGGLPVALARFRGVGTVSR